MINSKNQKKVIVIALVILVISLGIGFSAYSKTLTISGNLSIDPSSSNFNVVFSKSSSSNSTGSLGPSSATSGSSGSLATLSGTTISDVALELEEVGTVCYTFYVRNTGSLDAYLKSVHIDNQSCTVISGTTVCGNVIVSININSTSSQLSYTSSANLSTGSLLRKNSYSQIELCFTENGNANGDYNIDFGEISFYYSSQK